jgi:hypothetical protein
MLIVNPVAAVTRGRQLDLGVVAVGRCIRMFAAYERIRETLGSWGSSRPARRWAQGPSTLLMTRTLVHISVTSDAEESGMAVKGDEHAVRSVVMDYVEGWFEGDADRMERALHPELVKRCRGIEGDDPDALETLSARQMIAATADGEGRREDASDRQIEIKIDHLSGGIASVQCFCHRYIDLLHLIDMPDGWKIVNAAGRLR